MTDFGTALTTALSLIWQADTQLTASVLLSLVVSLTAVLWAALLGLPLGALLALARFPGRRAVIVVLNALMGLPPVVAGLLVYLLLSRAGPLGEWGLLFTPTAMVIAQTLLVTPIIAALTRQVIADLWGELHEYLRALGVGPGRAAVTLLWEARFSLLTVVLAGLGRALAEVGAIIIVGGNIVDVTRTMTTTIALQTSKGDLPLALGLGIVLVSLALLLNGAVYSVERMARRWQG